MRNEAFEAWKLYTEVKNEAFRESAEEIAAIVITLYEEAGFAAALDYSKAYEHMDPQITKRC